MLAQDVFESVLYCHSCTSVCNPIVVSVGSQAGTQPSAQSNHQQYETILCVIPVAGIVHAALRAATLQLGLEDQNPNAKSQKPIRATAAAYSIILLQPPAA